MALNRCTFYLKEQKGKIEYNIACGGGGVVGVERSEDWKRKISESKKGKNNPMYGTHWKPVDGKRVCCSQSGKVVLILVVTK